MVGYRGQFSIDGNVTWEDRWAHLTRTERLMIIAAVLNFALLFAVAMMFGGDAVNGKSEGGRYFLGNRGRYTEVSSTIYHASLLQVFSLLITHPLAMYATWRGQRRAKRALKPEA